MREVRSAGIEVWVLTGSALLGWLLLLRRGRVTVLPVIVTSIVALVLLAFFFGYMFNLGSDGPAEASGDACLDHVVGLSTSHLAASVPETRIRSYASDMIHDDDD